MKTNMSEEKQQQDELDALIDREGCSLAAAAEYLRSVIARRAAEGKGSPRAESQLAAILALPSDYQTPKMALRQEWRDADAALQSRACIY